MVIATEDIVSWGLQFCSKHNRHSTADDPRHDSKDEVHCADILVVRRINEPPPTGRVGMVIVGYVCV